MKMGTKEDFTMRNLLFYIHLLIGTSALVATKSRRLKWVDHVARMEEVSRAFKILIGTRPLVRPRRRWEDNIRMVYKIIGINKRN